MPDLKNAVKKRPLIILLTAILSLFPFLIMINPVEAGIEESINFQGKLVKSDGTNINNGYYYFRVGLYDGADAESSVLKTTHYDFSAQVNGSVSGSTVVYSNQTGESHVKEGMQLWNTTRSQYALVESVDTGANEITLDRSVTWGNGDGLTTKIRVSDGIFNIKVVDFSGIDFDTDSQDLYVGVGFDSDGNGSVEEVFSPRKRMSAVPYAFMAKDSGMLDGEDSSYYLDVGNATGTLDTDRFDAYGDLTTEGYLDNDADSDLLTRFQADSRYASGSDMLWSDGGSYLAPADQESIRVYDSGESDYLDLSHDGTNAVIDTGGTATALTLDTDFLPDTDDTYRLGTPTNRWSDLYLGPESLHIGTDGNEGVIGYDTTGNMVTFDPDGDGGEEIVMTDGGRLGVGTAGPNSTLDVAGDIEISDLSSSLVLPATHSDNKIQLFKGGEESIGTTDHTMKFMARNFGFYAPDGSTTKMLINDSGNVGIGDTDPTEGRLVVAGRTQTNELTMTSGAGIGYFMTSNSAGDASWQDPSTLSVGSASDANTLDSYDSSYFLNASNIESGTLSTDRYDAYSDLQVSGRLDGTDSGDLMYKEMLDSTFLNTGEGDISTASDFNFDATTHIANLDADYFDGYDSSYYLDAGNFTGSLSTDRYSAYGDLTAEGYLDNDSGGDLLTRDQLDGRFLQSEVDGSTTNELQDLGFTLGTTSLTDYIEHTVTITDGTNATVRDYYEPDTQLSEGTVEGYISNDVSSGYLAYDDGSKLSTSGVYYDGTNVGIRTNTPNNFALQVNGDIGPDSAVTESFNINTVDSVGSVGQYTSIALDSSGNPVISYSDDTNDDLKVAVCDDSTCSGSTINTVDSGGSVGRDTSIALGVSGNPVISYSDGTNTSLKVAVCDDSQCSSSTIRTVDSTGTVGQYTSIALDSSGNPVISYYDTTNADLKVAVCDDSTCSSSTITTVDSGGSVGQYTSIALDSSGNPVISYYDTTNADLKVAVCDDSTCSSSTITTVDSGGSVGQYTSIELDSKDNPVISYYDVANGDLKVAVCDDSTCSSNTLTTVDSGGDVGRYTSIELDSKDNPVISYYDLTNGDLKIANLDYSYTGGSNLGSSANYFNTLYTANLDIQSTDLVGNLNSDLLDSQDGSYYLDLGNATGTLSTDRYSAYGDLAAEGYLDNDAGGDLLTRDQLDGRYATTSDLSWSDGGAYLMPADNESMRVYDSGGADYIDISHDGINANITTSGTGAITLDNDLLPSGAPSLNLSSSTLTLDSSVDLNDNTSIAIGEDGNPVIAYYDSTNLDLRVLWCNDPSCSGGGEIITTVDSSGFVGMYSSIAIGEDGFPVISYRDSSNQNLKVAKCNDKACTGSDETISTVDNTVYVDQGTSIAVGDDGYPVIAYYEVTNEALRIAKCNDIACSGADETITQLDSTVGYGPFDSSVNIAGDGNPVISYFSPNNSDLKVADCNDDACSGGDDTITTVDSTGFVGQFSSLVLGEDGNPIISYIDVTNNNLKLVDCNDTACAGSDEVFTTLDSGEIYGSSTAIDLGVDGNPVVSYRETWGTSSYLRFIKCNDPACSGTGELSDIPDSDMGIHGGGVAMKVNDQGDPIISYFSDDGSGGDLKLANIDYSYTGGSNLGSSANYFNNVYAANYYGKSLSIGNFDVAEDYRAVDETIEAGDVVVPVYGDNISIDKSQNKYEDTVMGVVSAAPGLRLSDWTVPEEDRDEMRPVALSGRVPVKITTENGNIKKGDYLTTSPETGRAMKACGEKYCESGVVVGMALEDFSAGESGDSEKVEKDLEVKKSELGDNFDEEMAGVNDVVETDSSEIFESNGEDMNILDSEGRIMMFVNVMWYDPKGGSGDNADSLTVEGLEAVGSAGWSVNGDTLSTEYDLVASSLTATKGVFSILETEQIVVGDDKYVVDSRGNVELGGDMTIAGEIYGRYGDVILGLGDRDGTNEFVVRNVDGEDVFSIDSLGKLTVSESSNGSVGGGSIEGGDDQTIIKTLSVEEDSRVFITLRDELNGGNIYVSEVKDGEFTVKVSKRQDKDIDFDWWVIN